MNVSMEFDKKSGKLLAAYIRLSDAKIHRTVEICEDECYADEDEQGNLIGVELLSAGEFNWVQRVTDRYASREVEDSLKNASIKLAAAA